MINITPVQDHGKKRTLIPRVSIKQTSELYPGEKIMAKTHRQSSGFIWGLIALAAVSLACNFVTGNRQPVQQDQQNQQQHQQQDQPPDLNLQPDQNQGTQPDVEDFDIVGIWESQVDTDQGTVSTQLILEHTGTFSQAVTWNDLMALDTGEYNIVGNAIHFTVTHHEPTEYMGQPLTWVTSFTYFVTPIDATSMIVEDHIMDTSWTMYKTGP
jgi:hypothetical protein